MKMIDRLLERDAAMWRSSVDEPTAELGAEPQQPTNAQLKVVVGAYQTDTRRTRRGLVAASLIGIAALISAILIAVTAHGGDHSPPSSDAAASPTTPAAGQTDSLSPAHEAIGRDLVTPTMLTLAQSQGLISMPWKLLAGSRSTSDLTIFYITGDGACTEPVGIYLEQTSTSVLVEVLSKTDSHGHGCPDKLTMQASRIRLDAPLGTRMLLHAIVSPPWSGLDLSSY